MYLKPFESSINYDEKYEFRVACSLSHMTQKMQETINGLEPVKQHRLGGAGNKVNRIALNEVESYI